MSKLRNDLIGKIRKMPEKWLLFINEAIDSLSEHSRIPYTIVISMLVLIVAVISLRMVHNVESNAACANAVINS